MEVHMELLTIATAARKAGVCIDTIRNYEREGLLEPVRDSAGRRIFTRPDVEAIRSIYQRKAIERKMLAKSRRVSE